MDITMKNGSFRLAIGLCATIFMGINTVNAAPEGEMKVTLLGTGTPIVNINRFGMSTLVEAGNQKLLFDVGRGAVIRLHQIQIPLRDINSIFFTHMHSDHLTGFPDLYASAPLPTDDGRSKAPISIYGPVGIDNFARGIEKAFTANNEIRLKGGETNEPATKISDHFLPEKGGVVYNKDGVKVTAFLVDHGHVEPAYGFRVDYAGHAVVLSGDTTYSSNLVKQAKGVDLLVHSLSIGSRELEKAYPDYVQHFYSYLANTEKLGQVLNETKPKDAVISHISLYSKGNIGRASEKEILSRVSENYKGKFLLGQDLMSFVINDKGVTRVAYDPSIRQFEPIKQN